MRQHFHLDRLVEYGTEPIPDTTRVVNPAWRTLDNQCRREIGLLNRERLRFADIHLPADLEPREVEAVQTRKGQLGSSIEERQK